MYKEKVSDHEALKEGVQQALAVGGMSRHFSFWRKFQGGALEGWVRVFRALGAPGPHSPHCQNCPLLHVTQMLLFDSQLPSPLPC